MKFKKIPKEYFKTIIDRLTRVTPAYIRYKRVFDDIIQKFYCGERIKNITIADNIKLAQDIINSSLECEYDNSFIYKLLANLEEKYFKFNSLSYQYLSSGINFIGMLQEIEVDDKMPKNVVWLKKICKNEFNLSEIRKKNSLLYPIEKIIICEGQTEFTLLNTIFKLFDFDFEKEGYLVIPAGGKNQVARKYYSMCEYCNLPLYILLDSDAVQIKSFIDKKIRPLDKLYIIESGEFEDLIPKNILQKTINYAHKNEFNCLFDDFLCGSSTVTALELIYKKYGFGEFKKAQFAQLLDEYIANNCTKDDFADSEISKIIELFKY